MSKKDTVLKTKVLDHFKLTLDGREHTAECLETPEPKPECQCPGPVTVWKLCYDYRAIAKIEEKIGKDIKKIQYWATLSSGSDFPVIVWGGLHRFNPEVTLEEVIDVLNPEAQEILGDEILKLLFPGIVEKIDKARKEQGASKPPNALPATT